jgi:hypothetical protein
LKGEINAVTIGMVNTAFIAQLVQRGNHCFPENQNAKIVFKGNMLIFLVKKMIANHVPMALLLKVLVQQNAQHAQRGNLVTMGFNVIILQRAILHLIAMVH